MNSVLLLGSKSPSRKKVLTESQIPFKVVEQDADESVCDWGLPLPQLVSEIALHKMNHVIMPAGKTEGEISFVLTADTMAQDSNGIIHGKPIDKQDARKKIIAARNGNHLCTSVCLDKKVWQNGDWITQERIQKIVTAEYEFLISDEWIDFYLEKSIGLQCSGAIAVEGFGGQFLKNVHGSYTAIVGLPVFEVRQALEKLGFFQS